MGTGQVLTMTDTLPDGLGAPDSICASASYDPGARQVVWTGTPAVSHAVTVTF